MYVCMYAQLAPVVPPAAELPQAALVAEAPEVLPAEVLPAPEFQQPIDIDQPRVNMPDATVSFCFLRLRGFGSSKTSLSPSVIYWLPFCL